MPIEKLDKRSRGLLAYLNDHADLSAATLADAFGQHYKTDIDDSLEALLFLEEKGFLKLKKTEDNVVIMIHVTHTGRMYEQNLAEEKREQRKKTRSDRAWNIVTLILSGIISVIVSLIMGGRT